MTEPGARTGWKGSAMAVFSDTRRKLPTERASITKHVEIYAAEGGIVDFYITVGEYEDGTPGEVFVKLGSKGDTVQALLDSWACAFSIALQCGADFEELVRKFAGKKFEPAGGTNDPSLPTCFSMVDYVVSWMAMRYASVKLISELDELREQGL